MTQDMTPDTTHDMKQFDTMIHPSLSYRHSTFHFTRRALRLAAVLLVMIVGVQSVWGQNFN